MRKEDGRFAKSSDNHSVCTYVRLLSKFTSVGRKRHAAVFLIGAFVVAGILLVAARNLKSSSAYGKAHRMSGHDGSHFSSSMLSRTPFTLLALNYTAAALADEIVALPGLPEPDSSFRQFAGYLDISPTKHIFYWYVEPNRNSSVLDWAAVPLSLWTNGGPGCSGLFGYFAEHGPFRATQHGSGLEVNPFSWNTLSHMLYVEIPVGVGFSYSEDETEYYIGDEQTARDNLLVLQTFFARFPHLRSSDLYLTSESYGGHYIPTLAREIIRNNRKRADSLAASETGAVGKTRGQSTPQVVRLDRISPASDDQYINLRGLAIGNPFTDPVENVVGMIDALDGHDVIPESLFERWLTTCRAQGAAAADVFYSRPCQDLQKEMWREVGQGVDPYALDWPLCADDRKSRGGKQRKALLQHLWRLHTSETPRADRGESSSSSLASTAQAVLKQAPWGQDKEGLPFQPCEDDYLSAYLNRADVKRIIHAKERINWEDCTNCVRYEAHDQDVYMEPVYRYLMDENKDAGLRVLLYSGDDDSVCGPRGTEMWLRTMGWKVTEPWRAWTVKEEVAGYMKTYENGLVFSTVLGAGHEVPAFTPEAAWELFGAFLKGNISHLRAK